MSNTYHQQNELVSVMLEDHGKATWKKILTAKEINELICLDFFVVIFKDFKVMKVNWKT